MSRRITQTLTIIGSVTTDERDRYGNRIVVTVRKPWPVFSVAPGATQEPDEPNRTAVVTGLTVYAPVDGPQPAAVDAVEVPNLGTFDVAGDVQTWDNNPHHVTTSEHGLVVTLQRKTG